MSAYFVNVNKCQHCDESHESLLCADLDEANQMEKVVEGKKFLIDRIAQCPKTGRTILFNSKPIQALDE